MKYLITFILGFVFILFTYCQTNNSQLPTSINQDSSSPDASAILDIQSNEKGLLIPRMDMVSRDAITTPATGLLIYQIDNVIGFYYYNGTTWTPFAGDSADDIAVDNETGTEIIVWNDAVSDCWLMITNSPTLNSEFSSSIYTGTDLIISKGGQYFPLLTPLSNGDIYTPTGSSITSTDYHMYKKN